MSADPLDPVLREKISQVFPDRDAADVLACLDRYGTEPYERERRRVQLAILKLCDEAGDQDLENYVRTAKQDYRDVLAWAEYPREFAAGVTTDAERLASLRRLDRDELEGWLQRGADPAP